MVLLISLSFWSTSLPLASARWVRSTIKHVPTLINAFLSINLYDKVAQIRIALKKILRMPRIEPWADGYKERTLSIVLCPPFLILRLVDFQRLASLFRSLTTTEPKQKKLLKKLQKKSSNASGKFLLRLRRQRTNPTNSRSLVNENTSVVHCAFAPFHAPLGSVINEKLKCFLVYRYLWMLCSTLYYGYRLLVLPIVSNVRYARKFFS